MKRILQKRILKAFTDAAKAGKELSEAFRKLQNIRKFKDKSKYHS